MPTVPVNRDDLFTRLGKEYTEEEFSQLCFDYGVELDEVTSEKEMIEAEQGADAAKDADDSVIYKIDIPANRPDLLCIEGIARALKVFLGLATRPEFNVVVPADPLVITTAPETGMIRPHVVCAVLRGVTFTPTSYTSFIELQTKLHQNTCRRRTLVAIGTHDLGNIKGPFKYEAKTPAGGFSFVPLQGGARENREVDGNGLFEMLKQDRELKNYLHIVENSPVIPVISDANGHVLSVPPLINGEYSKISHATRDIFIECTATDFHRAQIVINTMCAMFGEYTTTPFQVEAVKVVRADGTSFMSPDMGENTMEVGVDYVNRAVGIDINAKRMVEMLKKMQMPASYNAPHESLMVRVPCTRSDVLHKCDLMEDIAIAYGFNNIERVVPPVQTTGKQQPMNHLTDLMRQEMAQAGYAEILTFGLCQREEQFEFMGFPEDVSKGVIVGNPKGKDFGMVRMSLLPGLLKTLNSSNSEKPPWKLFEASDVVLVDETEDVGARNERRLCSVYSGTTSGFEYTHGIVDRVMLLNRVEKGKDGYQLVEPKEPHPSFFPGRCAEILLRGVRIGYFGIVHPKTLKHFDIKMPVSAMEMCIEGFL